MPALQIAIVLALLIVCGFAPGFFFVRRLPWNPIEKLCASIGLSLILLYLATWAYYCFWPGASRFAYAGVAVICLALGLIAWKDIARLVRAFRVRQALLGYAFLLAWTLVILGTIRVYSGAGWFGDWEEHFQRTLFFLHRFPVQTPIITGYALPARPPLMNVLAAFFLALTGDRFEIFQVVYSCLNLLMFLPCCLVMPALGGRPQRSVLPLVALFAMSPVAMEAVTYTWPRGLTTFFIVSALAFYLAGWRKDDPVRMTAAFAAMSAGILTHYSAGPYAVFIVLHYATFVLPRRMRGWREPSAIVVSCSLLLATWFGWSIATYGIHATFTSNTTITSSQAYTGSTVGRIAGNIYHSVVPAVMRSPSSVNLFSQPNHLGFIRDNAFIIYQSNVIFSMGLFGGVLVLGLLYRYWRTGGTRGRERRFWLAMIPFCIVLGIAVVGEADFFGVAHVTLLPLAMIGLTMLAGSFPLPKIAMVVLIAGCAADFSLGILLHARIEGLENRPGKTYFAGPTVQGGRFTATLPQDAPSQSAWANWRDKHEYALSRQWLQDVRQYPTLQAYIQSIVDSDDLLWRGWFKRNGGSIVFLGDDLANLSFDGNWALPALLFLLLGYLLWVLWKQRYLLF